MCLKQRSGLRVEQYKNRRRELIMYARENRKKQTPAEAKLWDRLKSRKLGVRFRHQNKFPPYYIVDFCCQSHRLVIEVDGAYHNDTVEYDNRRTEWLESKKFMVIRFTNEQVLSDIDSVVRQIVAVLNSRATQKTNYLHLVASYS